MKGYAKLLNDATRIVASIEDNEGEITEEVAARIESFVGAYEDKLKAYRAVAFSAQTQERGVDEEIKRLRRLKAHYSRVSATVHTLAHNLATRLQSAGESADVKGVCKVKTSKRANFPSDPEQWPDDYKTVTTTVKLDTVGLKKAALNDGVELPEGFTIEEREYIKFDGVKAPS